MADHFQEIYNHHPEDYDRLVEREDYQGNILPALNQIRPITGLDVVELGAGTGRLSCLIAPLAKSIQVFDGARPMLDQATAKLTALGLTNWTTQVADNRQLPVANQVADLSIAGWSFGHLTSWEANRWQQEIDKCLAEMKRVLRPGGTVIIIETLGTGFEQPTPPDNLKPYFHYLEAQQEFSTSWIRTDYQFASLGEAEALTRFFFGDALAQKTVENNWVILPECTGIWWLTLPR